MLQFQGPQCFLPWLWAGFSCMPALPHGLENRLDVYQFLAGF